MEFCGIKIQHVASRYLEQFLCSNTIRAVRDIKTAGAEAVRVAISFSQGFKFLNISDVTKT
jgi:hypothetical protein